MTDRLDTPEQKAAMALLSEWPADMTLLSACRNIDSVRDDIRAAIARATLARETRAIASLCEDFVAIFTQLGLDALHKDTK